MIIKVCGLNNTENLLDIAALDIDMVGYNFYPQSPRYLSVLLPKTEKCKVGIFVNADLDYILDKITTYALDYVQLHGDETIEDTYVISKYIPVIKVFRVSEHFDHSILNAFDFCHYHLFDTYTPSFGGQGEKFDWNMLHGFDIQKPFILSGGISPSDVDHILKFSHPHYAGIDINSKFEIALGVKDVNKVKHFVQSISDGLPKLKVT
jgi:phosphoribosylanthranilate isomerase